MHKFRFAPLLFVVLSLVLTACPGTSGGGSGSAPQITSFTANPETITAAGQAVALSWTVTNGVTSLEIDNGVGAVSGTSEVVYPSATTTYTLTASNSSGTTSQSVTVSVGPGVGPTPGPGAEDGLPPTLNTFGVSLEQTDFQSDQGGNIEDADDPRIVRVQPNGTFYAVVSASDPGGIAGVTIVLANSSPPGLKADLAEGQSVGGFTLNGEVSNCVLDGTQTSITCVYEIAVGNIPNVTALPGVSGEFAYVFRTRVADAAGNESDTPPRGYIIVGSDGGTTDGGTTDGGTTDGGTTDGGTTDGGTTDGGTTDGGTTDGGTTDGGTTDGGTTDGGTTDGGTTDGGTTDGGTTDGGTTDGGTTDGGTTDGGTTDGGTTDGGTTDGGTTDGGTTDGGTTDGGTTDGGTTDGGTTP